MWAKYNYSSEKGDTCVVYDSRTRVLQLYLSKAEKYWLYLTEGIIVHVVHLTVDISPILGEAKWA